MTIYKNYLYGAYGSNLNKQQMQMRCPKAKPVGTVILPDYELVFRSVADIQKAKGVEVPLGLWLITADCEQALDRYEGYPYLYTKTFMDIEHEGEIHKLMTYQMTDREYQSPPSNGYLKSISDGYNDFDIDQSYLSDAVSWSYIETSKDSVVSDSPRTRDLWSPLDSVDIN